MPEQQQTRVRSLRVKSGIYAKEARLEEEFIPVPKPQAEERDASRHFTPSATATLTDCSVKPGAIRWIRLDNLLRNVAVVGAIVLVVIAVRNTEGTPTQSVFAALQSSMNMEWDESLGKLSFVSNLLPGSVQGVWNEAENIQVLAPSNGELVHAWSPEEPYIELQGIVRDVRAAANGEIMSIAHGLDEEVIVRIRHDDSTETLYGNLAACHMDVGDYVFAGDIIGTVLDGSPLAFELRKDGRSIDPKGKLHSLDD
ncbi:MAG: M23 family metallopeptidase [Clostridiales bacterium]|nr:M23 family metallopeptidase [Clostridiales bacterium]